MALIGKRMRVKKITQSVEQSGYSIEVGDGYALVVPTDESGIRTYVPLQSLDLPPVSSSVFVVEQPAH
jgi:hypothetical protein